MIVTLTANPSLDRTISLDGPLVPGAVHRAQASHDEPGGKGVNVARAVAAAGAQAIAVLPAGREDPLLHEMRHRGLEHHAVHVDDLVRVNLTVTEPDGTTTKLNLPGSTLSAAVREELAAVLLKEAAQARWVVLSGSVPPGTPDDWYAQLARTLREHGCRVAVDTSGAPLHRVLHGGDGSQADLVKPNSEELAEALGLEASTVDDDPRAVAAHARTLVALGTSEALVTLGAHGAVLATADGAWLATPPPTVPRSTVGAGDSALAGYLLADLDGAPPQERLRRAVAYGSAAAGLPGSAVPAPAQAHPNLVTISPIH